MSKKWIWDSIKLRPVCVNAVKDEYSSRWRILTGDRSGTLVDPSIVYETKREVVGVWIGKTKEEIARHERLAKKAKKLLAQLQAMKEEDGDNE